MFCSYFIFGMEIVISDLLSNYVRVTFFKIIRCTVEFDFEAINFVLLYDKPDLLRNQTASLF